MPPPKVKETKNKIMKRFSEQFNKKASTIKMSVAEKRDLKERVVSYMEYHPLPKAEGVQKTLSTYATGDQTFKVINFDISRAFRWSGALVIVLVLGTSFLAEKSIPGDALYAIKVGFNEEIRSTMAIGSYEKIVWETERLNRRISEARLLADSGRLTEEVEAKVASAVKEHSENARKEIENLKLTDKDEATMASIELTTALDMQNTSLRNRGNSDVNGASTDLIEIVLAESKAAEQVSEDNNLPAYNKLIARVELETTRAQELLSGVKESATAEEQKDISRRLEDIDRKIETAMSLAADDDSSARKGLVEALQQTHRLIVFMTNIDVRANLTVDELVPVTLTLEERKSAVEGKVRDAKRMLKFIEAATGNSTTTSTTTEQILDQEKLAKVQPALIKVVGFIEAADALLLAEPLEIEAAEAAGQEAYNLTLDITKLLEMQIPVAPETDEVIKAPVEEVLENSTSTAEVADEELEV
jgi:hypothetical protein